MKPKHILALFILMILAVALSACSGQTGVATSWPGLVSDGDTVYVAYGTHIYALQASSGAQKWIYPEKADAKTTFYADPVLTPDGKQLIAGSYNHILYSLNPANGQVLWQFTGAKSRYVASALVTPKGIFIANADKNLYAINLDGTQLWKYTTPAESWSQPITNAGCDCIYLPTLDHRIYALNAENGALLWKTEPLNGAMVGTPALSDQGILYVGTFGNEIVAINSSDGKVVWRQPTEGWVWSGPALANNNLYFGDLKGNFYALDATNGQKLWQLTPQQLDGAITGTPLVLSDSIYVGTENGTLFALDASGGIRWKQAIGGKLYTAPVAESDNLLLAPIPSAQAQELVVAVSQQDGQKRWPFIPPK